MGSGFLEKKILLKSIRMSGGVPDLKSRSKKISEEDLDTFAADFLQARQAASIMIHLILSRIKGTLLHMERALENTVSALKRK